MTGVIGITAVRFGVVRVCRVVGIDFKGTHSWCVKMGAFKALCAETGRGLGSDADAVAHSIFLSFFKWLGVVLGEEWRTQGRGRGKEGGKKILDSILYFTPNLDSNAYNLMPSCHQISHDLSSHPHLAQTLSSPL